MTNQTDGSIRLAAMAHLDRLTKPVGALGRLEDLAVQICVAHNTLNPKITRPVALVFAADHGIANAGVSAYPQAVTAQMVANFLAGGAAISVLAKEHGFDLRVIDAGVDAEFAPHPALIDAKIRRGTRDCRVEAAMTVEECQQSLVAGKRISEALAIGGTNTMLLGEMGIGNTSASALLMHCLSTRPLGSCVGRGTGLDDAGLARKLAALREARARAAGTLDPHTMLAEFGGYEIAMLVGATLAAAERRLLILVDGFTVTVAVALAARIDPSVLDACVFSHCSAEPGHRALLRDLGAMPLLDLGMRLGEGSGAALALPLARSAVAVFHRMATFDAAGVSRSNA